ncbi:MAG: zf-HC2 domain-containing protein [Acidobacteria bacterium]|nr:zf-HC2 domain-containing protein [Acidobacteriota bacterium]
MSSCRKLLSEVSNYLNGEVDAETRKELETHAAKCPKCWVVIDTTRKTIQIFQECEPYPIPETLQEKLQQALQKHYRESSGGQD